MAAQTITKVPYVDNETVIGAANLNAIQDAVNNHASLIDGLDSGKVDKVTGKGLSTNDFNNDAQSKLNNLPSGPELDTSLGQKVDKRTSGTEVYTHSGSTQGGAALTETPMAGAVPQYGTGGVLKAGAPVAANDVVRKAELDEVVDEMSDSTTGLRSKAPAIIETVGPAAIASFDDGADGMPIKKLVAQIEPVQDLHGYENPWPAGGGKNLYQAKDGSYSYAAGIIKNVVNGAIGLTGIANSTFDYHPLAGSISDTTQLTLPAGTYTVSISGLTSGMSFIMGSSGSEVPYYEFLTNGSHTFTLSAEGGLGYDILRITSGTSVNTTVKIQVEAGSTATPWASNSNICPISGFTGANVTRTGKNLVPTTGGNLPYSGNGISITESNGAYTIVANNATGYPFARVATIKGLKAGTYRISYERPSGFPDCVRVVNRQVNPAVVISSALSFTLSENITDDLYVEISLTGANIPNGTYVLSNLQIELGSTATTYAQSKSETYPITFPSEAGTVYGGRLTVNPDRTGTLVVDRRKRTISSFAGAWGSTPYGYAVHISATQRSLNWNVAKCNQFKLSKTEYQSMPLYSFLGGSGSNNTWTFILPNTVTSVAEANSWLSNLSTPLEIIYALETRITYILTTEQVSGILSTLYGQNNIWSSTGDTEVTYPADTKLYIDNKITQAIANALNS